MYRYKRVNIRGICDSWPTSWPEVPYESNSCDIHDRTLSMLGRILLALESQSQPYRTGPTYGEPVYRYSLFEAYPPVTPRAENG